MAELETPTTPQNGEAAPASDRASILAELKTLDTSTPQEGPGEPSTPPDSEPDADKPAEEPAVPPPAEEPAEDEDADDEESEEETKPGASDPDLNKRLDAVHKREKRAKESMAREREAYQREKAAWEKEWAPKVELAEKVAELSRRVRHDPVGVLMGLGLTEDDLDPIARVVYAHSKEARQDPKLREAAQRSMRERELADQVQQLTHKMEERDRRDQERERQETTQREVTRYLDEVSKAAGDDTPLVQTMLAKNADKTRARLGEVAHRLIEESGEVPDHAEVVAELEKIRRAELEELGIDPDSAIKRTKKPSPEAEEKRPAKHTLTNDLGKPATPRSAPVSRKEELADVRKALEEGRLE